MKLENAKYFLLIVYNDGMTQHFPFDTIEKAKEIEKKQDRGPEYDQVKLTKIYAAPFKPYHEKAFFEA